MKTLSRFSSAGILLGAVLVIAPGCRSDGGIGRADSSRGLRWASRAVVQQHSQDVESTARNVRALGGWFADEVSHPLAGLERTLTMYLEGSSEPVSESRSH